MSAGNGTGPVVLCYGTRPQTIKASVVRARLAERHAVLAVDTGQHYDFALNALLYEQLGVAPPDRFLEVGSGSHAMQTAAILTRAEALLRDTAAAAMVVIGDTNSTLGAALAAAKARIPVVHVEAGLRATDLLMAEEINRRAVDAIASLLCAPSRAAAERLTAEAVGGTVVQTGDVAHDVLRSQLDRAPAVATVLPAGVRAPYIVATLHRAELTDRPGLLGQVLDALAALPLPVVFPMHPRTRDALVRAGLSPASRGSLHVLPAVGYHESIALVRGARIAITDSGGVQREAYWLGVPCITLRHESEWAETVALGANELLEPARAPSALAGRVAQRLASAPAGWDRSAYGDGSAGERIADAVTALLGARG